MCSNLLRGSIFALLAVYSTCYFEFGKLEDNIVRCEVDRDYSWRARFKFICGEGEKIPFDGNDMICQQNKRNDVNHIGYVRFENCTFEAFPKKLVEHFRHLYEFDFSSVAYKVVKRSDFEKIEVMVDRVLLFDLSFNEIVQIDAAVFSHLKSVKELNIHHNRIKKLDPLAFDGLVNLVDLDLSHNELSEFTSLSTVPLQNLMKLDLSFNNITSLGNFSSMVLLESLDLSHNRLVNSFGDAFDVLQNLVKLNLSYNEIVDMTEIALVMPSNLTELDLSFNNIATIGTNSVIILENKVLLPGVDGNSSIFTRLYKLKSLDLSNNKITRIDYALLSSGFKMLQSLYLNGNQLKELTPLINVLFPNLEVLAVTHNIFNCSYLRDFVSTINVTILEHKHRLNLSELNVYGITCKHTHNLIMDDQSSMNSSSIVALTIGIVLIVFGSIFVVVLMRREQLFQIFGNFRKCSDSDV